MSKAVNLLAIILFSIIFLSGCYEDPICHDEIWLHNSSNDSIYWYLKKLADNDDTLLNKHDQSNPFNVARVGIIEPDASHRIQFTGSSCYEYLMNDFGRKYYVLAILDLRTEYEHEWDTIVKYDMVLKRYLIDLDLLQKNNFIIEYP